MALGSSYVSNIKNNRGTQVTKISSWKKLICNSVVVGTATAARASYDTKTELGKKVAWDGSL